MHSAALASIISLLALTSAQSTTEELVSSMSDAVSSGLPSVLSTESASAFPPAETSFGGIASLPPVPSISGGPIVPGNSTGGGVAGSGTGVGGPSATQTGDDSDSTGGSGDSGSGGSGGNGDSSASGGAGGAGGASESSSAMAVPTAAPVMMGAVAGAFGLLGALAL